MDLALDEQLRNSRQLAAEKRGARAGADFGQPGDDAGADVAEEIKKMKKVMRIFNIIFAISGVGLPVTFLNMLRQAFVGNLLGVKTMALESEELWALAILFILLLLVLILFIMAAMLISGPWLAVISFLKDALDSLLGN